MSSNRIATFLNLQGQTSPSPYLIDVDKAQGIYFWDKNGKRYMDMIAGVAVNNIGHSHPKVISAIKNQLDKHLHVMVYGEYLQDAQIDLAENLASILPSNLNCSYIVNSGTEANEAALKLAKRYTGRQALVACKNSYHGSTHGSLSVTGNETKQSNYKPLLPNIQFIEFNNIDSLDIITNKTAGVLIETIQGDAGLIKPTQEFLVALRKKCTETGALLIFDEVQVGMGRTGKFFAFEHYNIIPDVLTLGKALGGGMPIGAFISSTEIMHCLTHNPMLGHITTFGGHPVICAAANACINVLKEESWIKETESKGQFLEDILIQSSAIKEIRRAGLFFAIEMDSFETVKKVVENCLKKGLIGFWFLSTPNAFRLSPPLSITTKELEQAGKIILDSINTI
ncbi:aspartate aminotransferase family protein [Vicingus serpentipes]|uniref:Aspartate aminotransferase family protein n=1 Tax=Vicingus serpentipes TaxID=1926625 RepID=A0A5C6RV05_9FLAO|nr:aspartate aminotransferase family protein [Vicingus serpentipes]TXB65805.1 aspartate aminotransferase family protein [Vicingus serpentipes]